MAAPNQSPTPSQTASNLPPPRKNKAMPKVSPPFAGTHLHRLIYALVLLTTLISAYYSYRLVQYKAEVGGWWNLALGRPSPMQQKNHGMRSGGKGDYGKPSSKGGEDLGKEDTVERRLNDLAEALGMPPKELASAIAGAVREYVPPASLSSVAAKETGEAVSEMISGSGSVASGAKAAKHTEEAKAGVVEGVTAGLNGFVGMDEP